MAFYISLPVWRKSGGLSGAVPPCSGDISSGWPRLGRRLR